MKFEKCAAVSHGYDIAIASSGSFIRSVADNVDHDICTLDGWGTFHAMGIIAAVTPSIKKNIVIPRHKVTNDDILIVAEEAHLFNTKTCLILAWMIGLLVHVWTS